MSIPNCRKKKYAKDAAKLGKGEMQAIAKNVKICIKNVKKIGQKSRSKWAA